MAVNTNTPLPEVIIVDDNSSCTQSKMVKYSHIWTIKNFKFYYNRMEETQHTFTYSARVRKSNWCILMNVTGSNSEDNLLFYLRLISCDKSEARGKFKSSLLNAKGEKTIINEIQPVHRFVEVTDWDFEGFVKRDFLLDEANGLLPDDTLTILCEVSIITDSISISWLSNMIPIKVPECRLNVNLWLLFEKQKFTDITLTVCGKELRAHKAILAAQSPVFSAMFEHEMEERKKNCVDIIDMDYEVMREMLRFIYTGTVANLEENANSLLAAADKYALERLKVMCEEVLCTSLTIENATNILLLAELHSAVQLKAQTINFIVIHAKDVVCTMDFKSMGNSHPDLLREILLASINRRMAPI